MRVKKEELCNSCRMIRPFPSTSIEETLDSKGYNDSSFGYARLNDSILYHLRDKGGCSACINLFDQVSPDACNKRGCDYFDEENYDKAIEQYNRVIDMVPSHVMALYNRGLAYSCKNDFYNSVDDFDEAIRLDPNHALAYCNRGFAYFNRGDIDKAIADLEAALQIDPNYDCARQNLNIARRKRGW